MSSKKGLAERVEELEKLVSNLQMALNISQALLKNINNNGMKLDKDMSNIMGLVNELQYRTLSMLENDIFDKDELNSIADDLKLKDFTSASDKEDIEKGFITSDITTAESIVIITSTSIGDNNDSGIFRSKLAIKDAILPDLKEKLVGLKVGDHIKTEINKIEHDIELIGIRELPKVEKKEKVEIPAAIPTT